MPTPPPLPPDWPFSARTDSRELIFFEEAKLPGFDGKWRLYCTMPIPDINEPAELDGLYGRGGLIRAGDYILRPYRRGGFVRRFNKGTYLTANRFRSEYDIHAALWNAGFPTVEPMGIAYKRRYRGVEGVYITKWADSLPWPRTWGDNENDSENQNQATQAAGLIRALASWGLWAPDLNATNFIVTPSCGYGIASVPSRGYGVASVPSRGYGVASVPSRGYGVASVPSCGYASVSGSQILALDWDRAKWTTKQHLLEHYTTRLERSLYKLNAPAVIIDTLRSVLMESQRN